jgi:hypothetical protein
MEGYSVTEAASVLGVPTERVWELLARGVLSGVPEGDTGMRVYLQPRPAPAAVDEPRRTNGHGNQRDAEPEASPFRELLTEFRNLTERYGQALLALGEARGEVASLRSRVDVLEARMDLRLPMSAPPPPAAAWGAPTVGPRERPSPVAGRAAPPEAPSAPAEEPVTEDAEPTPQAQPADEAAGPRGGAERDMATETESEAEPVARRRRGRGHFSDEFAEALARAEDPSPAVLPTAAETGRAFASIRYEMPLHQKASEAESADALLPRELPAAEPMAIAEPEIESEPRPELALEADTLAEREPEPEPEPDAQTVPEPHPEAEAEAAPETEPQPEQGPGSWPPAAEAAREPMTHPEPQVAEDEGEPEEEPTWDRERYSTDIEAPDWWTPEARVWADPEVASDQPTVDEPSSVVTPIDDLEPAATISESSDVPAPANASPSTEWPSEDAAAEMEVASTGRRATAEPEPATAMPGSQELHEALAALDATATRRAEVTERPPASPSAPVRPSAPARSGPASAPPQPGELRSPASRAYRRLRRIFPS